MIEMEPDSVEVAANPGVGVIRECPSEFSPTFQNQSHGQPLPLYNNIGLQQLVSKQFFSKIGWNDVPEDLIYLLLSKIGCLTSYIRFSYVCRFWHSIASTNKLCKHRVAPWLMLSEKNEDDYDIREFYDISRNEVYQFPLVEAKGKKILGSAHGWLIMVDKDGQFNLFNPLNRTQITLPPYTSFQSVKAHPLAVLTPQEIRDVFTSRATLIPDQSTGGFVVVVVHMGYNELVLSLCRSSDSEWIKLEANAVDRMLDFACGHFFNMNMFGEIFTFKVTPTPKMELFATLDSYDTTGSYYVAECDGEIFLVSRFRRINDEIPFDMWDGTGHRTDYFRVYKLDLKNKHLTEIRNIGDYALFVGFNSTICLPVAPNTKAYKRNSIYFTDDYHAGIFSFEENIGGLDMGVYNLDDGSFGIHYAGVSKSNFSIPIWLIPALY